MTDATPAQSAQIGQKNLRVRWTIPDTILPQYVTNFTVQRLQHEYVISLYQLIPPLILGSPEQVADEMAALETIDAKCVFQMLIAAERLPELLAVLSMAQHLPVAFGPAAVAASEAPEVAS